MSIARKVLEDAAREFDTRHPLSPVAMREVVIELAREPKTWGAAIAIADLMFERFTSENLVDPALRGFENSWRAGDVRAERHWWWGVSSALVAARGGASLRASRRRRRAA